jgi:hypothetical protein
MLEQKSQFKLIYLRIDFRTATTGPNITITYFSPFSTQTFEDLIKAMRFMFLTKYSWKICYFISSIPDTLNFPDFKPVSLLLVSGYLYSWSSADDWSSSSTKLGSILRISFGRILRIKLRNGHSLNFCNTYICLWSLVITYTYKN